MRVHVLDYGSFVLPALYSCKAVLLAVVLVLFRSNLLFRTVLVVFLPMQFSLNLFSYGSLVVKQRSAMAYSGFIASLREV